MGVALNGIVVDPRFGCTRHSKPHVHMFAQCLGHVVSCPSEVRLAAEVALTKRALIICISGWQHCGV